MKARKSKAPAQFSKAAAREQFVEPLGPHRAALASARATPKLSKIARAPLPIRVLAVDPGYDRCGVAILEGDPSRPTLLWSGCITPPKGRPEARLGTIARELAKLIKTYAPATLAAETLFFSTNVKTAIGVAQARGVALAAAGLAGIPALEISPQQVKLAVTGYGAADKRAVGLMVPKLVLLAAGKRLDDELDAIALGIAALAQKSAFAQIEGARRA
jgi:crossover junction endodeoxyribonuclease RuvC